MIPFLDIEAISKPFEQTFHEKMNLFLEKGFYILGHEVKAFQEDFASYRGLEYCVCLLNVLDVIKVFCHLSFPITEKIHDEVPSLPINSVLKEEEVSYVIKALNQF